MSKMKLTESQARRAIRKWLFEFATDSGVSHRASTDDKIAGKLGDDREDQPMSTIPQDIPIIATSQMSTQLTTDMPPIEDPDFIPGTVGELGKSVDLLSQQIPHSEIEWFYSKMQDLADEAITKGNSPDLTALGDSSDGDIDDPIRPSTKSSQEAAEATNESWERWSRLLSGTLKEARRKSARQRDFARNWKQGDRLDLYRDEEDEIDKEFEEAISGDDDQPAAPAGSSMSGSVEDGEYQPSQEDLEDMADEFDADIDDLVGFNPNRHKTKEQRQAELASGQFDGEAKLRELVSLGVYPKVRTMSGMRKKIKADIDPIVQMYATARPAFDWLMGFYDDEYQLTWEGQQISGPDVYNMAIQAYEKFHRKRPEKLRQLMNAMEGSDFYVEALAEIVLAPIIKKWLQGVNNGTYDVSSSKARNNFVMSDWILETVLNSGFGKSGNKRRAKKLEDAMTNMTEFNDAMSAAQTVAQAMVK